MRHTQQAPCICSPQLFQCLGLNRTQQRSHNNNLTDHNSDFGRIVYTLAMLSMFAFVIVLVMIRSIRRSRSTVEIESLLEAMRYREEHDLIRRHKHRLQKTKRKVTAWLARNNNKAWQSSSQLILNSRKSTQQSGGYYIPSIVVTPHDDNALSRANSLQHGRAATPALSLLYDFDAEINSVVDEIQLSEVSTRSASLDMEPLTNNRRRSQLELIPSDSDSASGSTDDASLNCSRNLSF